MTQCDQDFIHEDNSPVAKWRNLFCPCNRIKGDMIKCYMIKCAERNTASCFKGKVQMKHRHLSNINCHRKITCEANHPSR